MAQKVKKTSDAQKRAQKKYDNAHLYKAGTVLPLEWRDAIQSAAAMDGQSVSAWIKGAIAAKLELYADGLPQSSPMDRDEQN